MKVVVSGFRLPEFRCFCLGFVAGSRFRALQKPLNEFGDCVNMGVPGVFCFLFFGRQTDSDVFALLKSAISPL